MLCERCGELHARHVEVPAGACAELCVRCQRDWQILRDSGDLPLEWSMLKARRDTIVLRAKAGVHPNLGPVQDLVNDEINFEIKCNAAFNKFVETKITRDSEGNPCK